MLQNYNVITIRTHLGYDDENYESTLYIYIYTSTSPSRLAITIWINCTELSVYDNRECNPSQLYKLIPYKSPPHVSN